MLSAAALLLYGALLLVLLRRVRADAGLLALRGTDWLILVPAVIVHATAVADMMQTPVGIDLGLVNALNVMLLVMSVFLGTACRFLPATVLLLVLIPFDIAGIVWGTLSPPIDHARHALDADRLPHVVVSIIAGSVLLLAFLQALLLRVTERHLKSHTLTWVRLVPPIETLESLLFSAIWTGFVLIVLGIVTGFLYLDDMFAQRVAHHTVLLSAAALVYGILLVGRYRFGWRGATATRWVLFATTLLVLGYFGSKFVLEVLLPPRP
ncbi:MAG: cytochrome c biogenesis protein CcsA [Pseudomonadales bacterium]|nr:cytochrome c biogenesis protein CcsA [Pseudomonadales bacterium]MCP5182775.1 cytochrome c biogenesis protein CcsA [Pseudomonadales bacterium]